MLPLLPTALLSDLASILITICISYCPKWGILVPLCCGHLVCSVYQVEMQMHPEGDAEQADYL